MSYHFYDMGFKDGYKKALQESEEPPVKSSPVKFVRNPFWGPILKSVDDYLDQEGGEEGSGQGTTTIETDADGNQFTRTVYPDGRVVDEYPDGSTRTTYPDGRVVETRPDGSVALEGYPPDNWIIYFQDGSWQRTSTFRNEDGSYQRTITHSDGTMIVMEYDQYGNLILYVVYHPNGQVQYTQDSDLYYDPDTGWSDTPWWMDDDNETDDNEPNAG